MTDIKERKNVIFDMDGVLFDTERRILDCWMHLGEKYGIPDIESVMTACIGTNARETRKIMLAHYGEEFPYEKYRQESSQLLRSEAKKQGIPVKKGARELLHFLKENDVRIGLASSTRKERVEEELSQTGLSGYFEVIVGGDMVKKSKPAPDIYLRACEMLAVVPAAAYAIEDSRNGLISAHLAGLKTILVPDLLEPDREMKEMAGFVRRDLLEVRDVFKEVWQ